MSFIIILCFFFMNQKQVSLYIIAPTRIKLSLRKLKIPETLKSMKTQETMTRICSGKPQKSIRIEDPFLLHIYREIFVSKFLNIVKIVTNCDVAKIHQCYYDEWYFHPTKHIQELNSFKEHTQLETQK